MRLHARTQLVNRARIDVDQALDDVQRQHNLTYVEMLQLVNQWQQECLRFMLRLERHPGDPDKHADQA